MGIVDNWLIKKIKWIKPLNSLTLDELFKLQQDVGKAIEFKLNHQP